MADVGESHSVDWTFHDVNVVGFKGDVEFLE